MNEVGQAQKPAKVFVAKDMMIGEVVEKYPEAAPIMQGYGLQCVGCHVSPYESIEQGIAGHGMAEGALDVMLAEVNSKLAQLEGEGKLYIQIKEKAVKEAEAGGQVALYVTERAAGKIRELAGKEGKVGYGLHFSVAPGGCSGFRYDLKFQKEAGEKDVTVEASGVKLFVDKESLSMVKGSTVDYVETLQESGFDIQNPNATTGCGCGKSFA